MLYAETMKDDPASSPAPGSLRRRATVFVAVAVAYYGLYLVVFAFRVSDYWKDVMRHFPFARKLFG